MALDIDADLSTITEEGVETVFAGYDFFNSKSDKDKTISLTEADGTGHGHARSVYRSPSSMVSLILNIAKTPASSWLFRVQSGAW